MYSFKTYMTGELFSLLIKHSILKNAVEEPGKDKPLEKAGTGAFLKGLHQSQYPDLLHQLFSLRVNRLFEKLSPLENYYYLSGLLIGAELRSVNGLAGDRIVLCCGSNMFALYRLALEGLELMPHTYLVDPQVMDQCVTAGHLSVLRYKMPHW
jgi:2-dehydro-3-deoxygalactonokinase